MNNRILLFDDNYYFRHSVETLISYVDGMELLAAYEDCRDILNIITVQQPDLVLMDINMPYVNGIEGLRLIRTQFPNLKVIILTFFEDAAKKQAAMQAGADGFVLKSANPERLLELISGINCPRKKNIGSSIRKIETNGSLEGHFVNKPLAMDKRMVSIAADIVFQFSNKVIVAKYLRFLITYLRKIRATWISAKKAHMNAAFFRLRKSKLAC